MKNEIREAYERMNPPQEAKERMMKNIMKKKAKQDGFYTATPTQERWWTAIPAALALVAVLVIGWQFLIQREVGPLSGNPIASANPTETNSSTELEIPGIVDKIQEEFPIPEGYAHVIGKYSRAHEEGWSVEEYMQNDICYVLGIQGSIEDYGYAFVDLDGNGIEELIITDGDVIYDMFTLLEDGGAGHILSSGERMRYFLCEDNVIGYRGSGGAANTVLQYYTLENGMDLVTEVCLEFDTDTWYKYESGGHDDLHPGPLVAITEDEVRHIQDAYKAVEIVYQSFLRPEAEKTNDTSETLPAGFAHVIEKYEKATTEDWTKDQYMQNDISYLLASKNIYWQYGYAQMDLNGDGSNELIITDGEEIYDVYILMEDGGAGHIISATDERSYFLCKDNIIGCQSLGTDATSWDFSRLLVGGDSELVMYLQKDADGWFKMEGSADKMVTISHEEADELIGGTYWRVEIPFQTILRLEPAEELIYPRTYVQLLREKMSEYSGIETMYVALTDVTGDGHDEMLLGLGPYSNYSFGHIYSVMYGGVSEILTYGKDVDFTLCKDGIICHHNPEKPFDNYVFISLKGGEYKILDIFAYSEDEKSWTRVKDGVRENISDTEMQEILDSHGSVSLEWMSVLEAIGG